MPFLPLYPSANRFATSVAYKFAFHSLHDSSAFVEHVRDVIRLHITSIRVFFVFLMLWEMLATSLRRISFPYPSPPHIPIHSLFPREALVPSLCALRLIIPEILAPPLPNEASASSPGEWTQEILNEVLSDAGLEHLIDNAVTAEGDTPYTFGLCCRFDDLRAASSSKIMFESVLRIVSFRFVDHHEYFAVDRHHPRAQSVYDGQVVSTARTFARCQEHDGLQPLHPEVYTLAEAFGNVRMFLFAEPDGFEAPCFSQVCPNRKIRHRLCQAVRASWLHQFSPQTSHLSICYYHNFATLLARVQTIKPLITQAKKHERAVL
ncbi:hypothetical protein E4T43_03611 [Aureobasidium subglaciale]|nr:hypothetical protein E4T43_03611 [Aureobasidium subglaciale]